MTHRLRMSCNGGTIICYASNGPFIGLLRAWDVSLSKCIKGFCKIQILLKCRIKSNLIVLDMAASPSTPSSALLKGLTNPSSRFWTYNSLMSVCLYVGRLVCHNFLKSLKLMRSSNLSNTFMESQKGYHLKCEMFTDL